LKEALKDRIDILNLTQESIKFDIENEFMTMEVYFYNLNSYLLEETKNLKRANQIGLNQANKSLIKARINKVK
jgi:hypothetical protein